MWLHTSGFPPNLIIEEYHMVYLGYYMYRLFVQKKCSPNLVMDFVISSPFNISPGELPQRRSTLISNNVLAWMAVRNEFRSFFRISYPFDKTEICRFVPPIKRMEEYLVEPQSDNKREKQAIVAATCQSAQKVLADILDFWYFYLSVSAK